MFLYFSGNWVEQGYDEQGYTEQGYGEQGYDEQGYDEQGYAEEGYAEQGYAEEGYAEEGYAEEGYAEQGYDEQGYDEQGYDEQGYDEQGYSEHYGASDAGSEVYNGYTQPEAGYSECPADNTPFSGRENKSGLVSQSVSSTKADSDWDDLIAGYGPTSSGGSQKGHSEWGTVSFGCGKASSGWDNDDSDWGGSTSTSNYANQSSGSNWSRHRDHGGAKSRFGRSKSNKRGSFAPPKPRTVK